MAWFTLKVLPGHEARLKARLEALLENLSVPGRVALPHVHTGDNPGAWTKHKKGIPVGKRWLKVRPGFLFLGVRECDLDLILEAMADMRGIGAMDGALPSGQQGERTPRALVGELARDLDRGELWRFHPVGAVME